MFDEKNIPFVQMKEAKRKKYKKWMQKLNIKITKCEIQEQEWQKKGSQF